MPGLYLARETDALVLHFRHDEYRPNASEALNLLRRAAALVRPIMVQYQWKIYMLCEFYDVDRNSFHRVVTKRTWLSKERTQNMIYLKLRHDDDSRSFRNVDEIVDNLLQELCIISNNGFPDPVRTLLPYIRTEYWDLRSKGHTGVVLQGVRLGNSNTYITDSITLNGQQSLALPSIKAPREALAARIKSCVNEAPLCAAQRQRRQLRQLAFD
ncbi:hypothetical protein KEM54_002612 [Ascosphaera aggregata]|nr:hypothetical protein KEM54_002612 [Ascosphaera aggregata]